MAGKEYLLTSATFSAAALAGAKSFTLDQSAQQLDTRADGELGQTSVALIGLTDVIRVTFQDLHTGLALGASGSLVLVAKTHTGAVTLAGTKTCTATGAVITNISRNAGQGDGTSVDVEFTVPRQSNGTDSNIAWT